MLHLVTLHLVAVAAAMTPIETPYGTPDELLRNLLDRYQQQQFQNYPQPADFPDYLSRALREPYAQYDVEDASRGVDPAGLTPFDLASMQGQMDYDMQQQTMPSLRDRELLQHSSLWGNQYMTGGAGEGVQHLSPEGAFKNAHTTKTDSILPAYCEPPNPCPVGYTADDGCVEDFDNTASFSRQYQSREECMCDSEHMFNCPDSTDDSELSALARSFANKGFSDSDLEKMLSGVNEPKVVAKKYHIFRNSHADNPYLHGEKLPVAAKKGGNTVTQGG